MENKQNINNEEYIKNSFNQLADVIRNKSSLKLTNPELNEVVFDYGNFGDLTKKDAPGGKGVVHIIQRRTENENLSDEDIASLLFLVKQYSETEKPDSYDSSKTRAFINKNGIRVVLQKNWEDSGKTWLVSGYGLVDEIGKLTLEATETIKAVTASYGYKPEHSFLREQVGAVIASIPTIRQQQKNVKELKNKTKIQKGSKTISTANPKTVYDRAVLKSAPKNCSDKELIASLAAINFSINALDNKNKSALFKHTKAKKIIEKAADKTLLNEVEKELKARGYTFTVNNSINETTVDYQRVVVMDVSGGKEKALPLKERQVTEDVMTKPNNNKKDEKQIWTWKEYDDLSGGLYSPSGKEYFQYDWTTKEYRINPEESVWDSFTGAPDEDTSFSAFKEYAQNYIKKFIAKTENIEFTREYIDLSENLSEPKIIEKTIDLFNELGFFIPSESEIDFSNMITSLLEIDNYDLLENEDDGKIYIHHDEDGFNELLDENVIDHLLHNWSVSINDRNDSEEKWQSDLIQKLQKNHSKYVHDNSPVVTYSVTFNCGFTFPKDIAGNDKKCNEYRETIYKELKQKYGFNDNDAETEYFPDKEHSQDSSFNISFAAPVPVESMYPAWFVDFWIDEVCHDLQNNYGAYIKWEGGERSERTFDNFLEAEKNVVKIKCEINGYYSWDDLYKLAENTAAFDPELKAKDNAREYISDVAIKFGIDIENSDIPEEAIDDFLKEHPEFDRFNENGNMINLDVSVMLAEEIKKLEVECPIELADNIVNIIYHDAALYLNYKLENKNILFLIRDDTDGDSVNEQISIKDIVFKAQGIADKNLSEDKSQNNVEAVKIGEATLKEIDRLYSEITEKETKNMLETLDIKEYVNSHIPEGLRKLDDEEIKQLKTYTQDFSEDLLLYDKENDKTYRLWNGDKEKWNENHYEKYLHNVDIAELFDFAHEEAVNANVSGMEKDNPEAVKENNKWADFFERYLINIKARDFVLLLDGCHAEKDSGFTPDEDRITNPYPAVNRYVVSLEDENARILGLEKSENGLYELLVETGKDTNITDIYIRQKDVNTDEIVASDLQKEFKDRAKRIFDTAKPDVEEYVHDKFKEDFPVTVYYAFDENMKYQKNGEEVSLRTYEEPRWNFRNPDELLHIIRNADEEFYNELQEIIKENPEEHFSFDLGKSLRYDCFNHNDFSNETLEDKCDNTFYFRYWNDYDEHKIDINNFDEGGEKIIIKDPDVLKMLNRMIENHVNANIENYTEYKNYRNQRLPELLAKELGEHGVSNNGKKLFCQTHPISDELHSLLELPHFNHRVGNGYYPVQYALHAEYNLDDKGRIKGTPEIRIWEFVDTGYREFPINKGDRELSEYCHEKNILKLAEDTFDRFACEQTETPYINREQCIELYRTKLGEQLLDVVKRNSLSMNLKDKKEALELIEKGADAREALRFAAADANMYENCHWLIDTLSEETVDKLFSDKEYADEIFVLAKESLTHDEESWTSVSDIGYEGFKEIADICGRGEEAEQYYKELERNFEKQMEEELKEKVESIFDKESDFDPIIDEVRIYHPEDFGYDKDDKLHLLIQFHNNEELIGHTFREDELFNFLQETGETFNGQKIDFNPIDADKWGTIDEYLEGLKKGREMAEIRESDFDLGIDPLVFENTSLAPGRVDDYQDGYICFTFTLKKDSPLLELSESLKKMKDENWVELYVNYGSEDAFSPDEDVSEPIAITVKSSGDIPSVSIMDYYEDNRKLYISDSLRNKIITACKKSVNDFMETRWPGKSIKEKFFTRELEPLELVEEFAKISEQKTVPELFLTEFHNGMISRSLPKNPFFVTQSIVKEWKQSKPELVPVLNEWLKKQGCNSKEGFEKFFEKVGKKHPDNLIENKQKKKPSSKDDDFGRS